ncbi:MAG: nucleotide pyrophosphatase/phosphodiesterase family protein, partial [Tepidisphaeraceae bacterium]
MKESALTANRVCVIDMPGLSSALTKSIPPASALGRWAASREARTLTPSFPAVTCSVQATLTTGVAPARHGILANGLPTFRSREDQNLVDASNFAAFRKQISFWEQSNQFLDAPRFWQDADGKSKYKTALLFFQNCMPGFAGALRPAADIVLTPKPDHGPDGKLTSLCWSEPRDLVPRLFAQFGPFPLMNYWGPMAGIASSQWIARASAWIWSHQAPALQLVYIPHLDYDLQRFGPGSPQARQAVCDAADAVEPLVSAVLESGGKIVLLSEYAMTDVKAAVSPNRLLAEAGLLVTRSTADGNLIDYEQSSAVALVDHQIAHVYCRDKQAVASARDVFASQPLLTVATSADLGLTHRRAGELVLRAAPEAWLDYRWWSDPAAAPSFAKMVDIHRKPGYDPLELFWDRAAGGVSQDVSLIRGSHGLASDGEAICVSDERGAAINATE